MLRMKRLLRTNPSDSSPALPKPARMRFGFGAWEQTLAFVEKNAYPFRLPPGNASEFQATGPFALKNRVFQRNVCACGACFCSSLPAAEGVPAVLIVVGVIGGLGLVIFMSI